MTGDRKQKIGCSETGCKAKVKQRLNSERFALSSADGHLTPE
jgi:hypothetical protein